MLKSFSINPASKAGLKKALKTLRDKLKMSLTGREFRLPIELAIIDIFNKGNVPIGIRRLHQVLIDMMSVTVRLSRTFTADSKNILDVVIRNVSQAANANSLERTDSGPHLVRDMLMAISGLDRPSELQEFFNRIAVSRHANDSELSAFIDSQKGLPNRRVMLAIVHCVLNAVDNSSNSSSFEPATCPTCQQMASPKKCLSMETLLTIADKKPVEQLHCHLQDVVNLAFRATLGILNVNRDMASRMEPIVQNLGIKGNPVSGIIGQRVHLWASEDIAGLVKGIMEHLNNSRTWRQWPVQRGLEEWFEHNKNYFCTAFQHLLDMDSLAHILGQIQDSLVTSTGGALNDDEDRNVATKSGDRWQDSNPLPESLRAHWISSL